MKMVRRGYSMSKTIFTNGTICTLDSNQPIVETVVVENGKISRYRFSSRYDSTMGQT